MEGAVGDANPLRTQTLSSYPEPWELREMKPSTEEHGLFQDPRNKCSRGLHCMHSVGDDTPNPVET